VTALLGTALVPALAVPPIIGPSWVELPPRQQQILAPLAADWDQFDAGRRKKWLEIADRYPKMGAEEQARLQAQMDAWSKLTPEQRHAARTKYRNVLKASPEQKEALKHMWNQYQALPEDQKQHFKEAASAKATAKPAKAPVASTRPPRAIPIHPKPAATETTTAAAVPPPTVAPAPDAAVPGTAQ